MSDNYLNDYVEGSLEKLCWNFCANCEKVICSVEEYNMYEGLCKECYYRRVYQEDMTPEQIDWIQPKEDITIIDNHPEYKCKRPMFAQFKKAIDARTREKNKDSNER